MADQTEAVSGLIEMIEPVFVERDCQVGGILCPMWAEWFQACDDTDPTAIDEERDPTPLLEWPFNPLGCERPDTCWHYRRARETTPSIKGGDRG